MTIEALTIQTVFAIMVVFFRVGAAMMVLPGIGETYVATRIRLFVSLAISVVTMPAITDLPPYPESLLALFLILFYETFIGLFIGLLARILIAAVHVMGTIIATQVGLGSAMMFDPNQGTQASMIGNLLGMLVVLLVFITNMHHQLILAIVQSYSLFAPGHMPLIGDHISQLLDIYAESFSVAVRFTAPQLLMNLLLMVGAGVLARLMPALQIFFLITPGHLLLGFFVLMMTISASTLWYLDYMHEIIGRFIE